MEETEGEAGEAGTLGVSVWEYLIMFGFLGCFTSLKTFLNGTNPPCTVDFSFSACITEGSRS